MDSERLRLEYMVYTSGMKGDILAPKTPKFLQGLVWGRKYLAQFALPRDKGKWPLNCSVAWGMKADGTELYQNPLDPAVLPTHIPEEHRPNAYGALSLWTQHHVPGVMGMNYQRRAWAIWAECADFFPWLLPEGISPDHGRRLRWGCPFLEKVIATELKGDDAPPVHRKRWSLPLGRRLRTEMFMAALDQ